MKAPSSWLFALARSLMPRERREWWDAMRAEADYLPAAGATRWACGCVVTALRERFVPMNSNDSRISRWVMVIEAIGCFGPLTLAWYEVLLGGSGLLRHTPEIVSKYYLPVPGGAFVFVLLVAGALVGVVGPVGLCLGLRYAATGRGLDRRWLGCALIGSLLAYASLAMLGWWLGPPGYDPDTTTAVLFVLIPVAGLAHLMFLARPVPPLRGAGLAAP